MIDMAEDLLASYILTQASICSETYGTSAFAAFVLGYILTQASICSETRQMRARAVVARRLHLNSSQHLL